MLTQVNVYGVQYSDKICLSLSIFILSLVFQGLRATCGECIIGLEYIFATFAMPETVDWLMEYVSGPAFCESSEDPEPCKKAIETVLPLAIPALAATQNSEEEIAFCKAVLGVC